MTGTGTLEVRDLTKVFGGEGLIHRQQPVRALNGVTLTLRSGEILGLVGESGCGKSTLARCLVGLERPTSGSIVINGRETANLSRRAMRPLRSSLQMIFQDPLSSLNPRMTVDRIIGEPLRILSRRSAIDDSGRVVDLLEMVGLGPEHRWRYPHELSGGQQQRVGIARALSVDPDILIADEPTSALDVSVQATIINLLLDLQQRLGFSCLFISHDLSVIEYVSNSIDVMYLGKIVEHAPSHALFDNPSHPYTRALLSAFPVPDPDSQRARGRIVLGGETPSAATIPSGCAFHPRCPIAVDDCRERSPQLLPEGVDAGHHRVRCHLVDFSGPRPTLSEWEWV